MRVNALEYVNATRQRMAGLLPLIPDGECVRSGNTMRSPKEIGDGK